jgi:hypothetical protein
MPLQISILNATRAMRTSGPTPPHGPVILIAQIFLNESVRYFHKSYLYTLDPFNKITEILLYMSRYLYLMPPEP